MPLTLNPTTGQLDVVNASNPGDITGITAGTGITGGGTTGDVSVALDTTYTDGRYVNVTGDAMTGALSIGASSTGYLLSLSNSNADGYGAYLYANNADNDKFVLQAQTTATNPILNVRNDGRVGINTSAPNEALDVLGNFQIINSAATKSYRFRTSGSDLDLDGSGANLLVSIYSGAGYTGTQRFYLNFSAGSQDADAFGNWRFKDAIFGSNRLSILSSGECVVNDDSADYDFRVESNNEENMIFVDGGNDRVGIGTNAPNNKLDVVGTVQMDGLRIDVSPTAETVVCTHTITVSVNGTNYKLPCVAA